MIIIVIENYIQSIIDNKNIIFYAHCMYVWCKSSLKYFKIPFYILPFPFYVSPKFIQ